jgi:hypothetical protein
VELFVASDRNITDASRGDALHRLVAALGTDALTFLELLRGTKPLNPQPSTLDP